MQFEMTKQQEILRDTVRAFIEKHCPREYQRELDEKEQFPHDLWDKLADLGMCGLSIDEKYGGTGGDITDIVLVVEELAKGMFVLGDIYAQFNHIGPATIKFFGNEKQKKEYLPKMAKGQLKVCLGITENHSGIDALALKTIAEEKADHFLINGHKMFITGAQVSDYITLMTRTTWNLKKKSHGISMFLVDMKTPGITIKKLSILGMKAIDTCEMFFDNVQVPKENLLGQKDYGWYQVLNVLNNERIIVAALCVGGAQAALEDSIQYAKARMVFNRPIGNYQAIQHYIADMYLKIELARLMTQKAAWLQMKNLPCFIESDMAKLAASEAALFATSKGMQIMSGYGYMMEHDMQRYWRDAKLFEFAPITNEIVRNFLAERLGLPQSY
jgi:acyl-CoA dehydrogenase